MTDLEDIQAVSLAARQLARVWRRQRTAALEQAERLAAHVETLLEAVAQLRPTFGKAERLADLENQLPSLQERARDMSRRLTQIEARLAHAQALRDVAEELYELSRPAFEGARFWTDEHVSLLTQLHLTVLKYDGALADE